MFSRCTTAKYYWHDFVAALSGHGPAVRQHKSAPGRAVVPGADIPSAGARNATGQALANSLRGACYGSAGASAARQNRQLPNTETHAQTARSVASYVNEYTAHLPGADAPTKRRAVIDAIEIDRELSMPEQKFQHIGDALLENFATTLRAEIQQLVDDASPHDRAQRRLAALCRDELRVTALLVQIPSPALTDANLAVHERANPTMAPEQFWQASRQEYTQSEP
jgi:hypothetical protein